MALTSKEQFRMGFLLRCAEEGLSGDEIEGRVKMALVGVTGAAFGLPALANAARAYLTLPFQLGAVGLGAAAIAGPAVGYSMAKMQQDDADPDEAKRQELIATYSQQADKIRRSMKQRRYRGQAPAAPKLFIG